MTFVLFPPIVRAASSASRVEEPRQVAVTTNPWSAIDLPTVPIRWIYGNATVTCTFADAGEYVDHLSAADVGTEQPKP